MLGLSNFMVEVCKFSLSFDEGVYILFDREHMFLHLGTDHMQLRDLNIFGKILISVRKF